MFRQLQRLQTRNFRSKAALESLARASEDRTPNLVLYNYPSFSGAFAALFAHLYHSRLHQPCLVLPFSSVEPLRVRDLDIQGLRTCYLLDFIGPKGFAVDLSRSIDRVVAFDHRRSTLSKVDSPKDCPENLELRVDVEKSSSVSVFEYFSSKFDEAVSDEGEVEGLLEREDWDRVVMVLRYIEDEDLRRRSLPEIRQFNVGLRELRSQLNCITNPYVFDQLLKICTVDIIAKGNSYISSRQEAAKKVIDKAFKVRLGRGLYGECLGLRIDGFSNLSDEIGKELSVRSAAAGLRPIGAVIYLQRKDLKMCLRSLDNDNDTSEVAKAYGGGGSCSSSSFIIRMGEYNQWIS
ncbi:hypothetical protein Scep_001386 [Stephania cephalantha]|uniref:DHHA1 domain-containing protein n=1 Tax=Stephania cephalantha TaxID=152367 RepID=A0AAP0Q3Q9_9MAGN